MIKKTLTAVALLLLTACQTHKAPAAPSTDEADGALKSAFLLDAQKNDTLEARDEIQQDVSHLRVTKVNACSPQGEEKLVCSVYSEFRPAGSSEVQYNLDQIAFSHTNGEWVATLSKP